MMVLILKILVVSLLAFLLTTAFFNHKKKKIDLEAKNRKIDEKQKLYLMELRSYIDKGELIFKDLDELNEVTIGKKIKDITLTKEGNFHLYGFDLAKKRVQPLKTKKKPKKEV